jgi:hypothetical protein
MYITLLMVYNMSNTCIRSMNVQTWNWLYIVEETGLIFPVYWPRYRHAKCTIVVTMKLVSHERHIFEMCVILVTKEVSDVCHVRDDRDLERAPF